MGKNLDNFSSKISAYENYNSKNPTTPRAIPDETVPFSGTLFLVIWDQGCLEWYDQQTAGYLWVKACLYKWLLVICYKCEVHLYILAIHLTSSLFKNLYFSKSNLAVHIRRAWEGGVLVTDGEAPPKSLCLQPVPEFLLKIYIRFRNFLSF